MKKVFFLLLALTGCHKATQPKPVNTVSPEVSVETGGKEAVARNPTGIEGVDIDGGGGKSR
jgi:hypothetical protein